MKYSIVNDLKTAVFKGGIGNEALPTTVTCMWSVGISGINRARPAGKWGKI